MLTSIPAYLIFKHFVLDKAFGVSGALHTKSGTLNAFPLFTFNCVSPPCAANNIF